jgi:YidC/Oxa1 family membrane protein insertase
MNLLTDALLQALIQLYQVTGNLGLALLTFTFIVRSLLLPLALPTARSQKKIRQLQPELNALKKKHGGDRQALQAAQLELYKKYNVNPLAGCLPQLAQIVILIVLYHILVTFLGKSELNGVLINPNFLWLDLSKPDKLFILPILAGVSQFILSLMILPGGETPDIVPNESKNKKIQAANVKEENVADMANAMQKQMIFMMPVMTGFIALRFPSGLALYWVATTTYSIFQQLALTGPGGLKTYTQRAVAFVSQKLGRG